MRANTALLSLQNPPHEDSLACPRRGRSDEAVRDQTERAFSERAARARPSPHPPPRA